MVYADEEYYKTEYGGSTVPDNELTGALKKASQHIDSLTFGRIGGQEFFNLTPFQQGTIREVCCLQADFEYENADMINTVLKNYAINGVSMSFGDSWNVNVENGVAIRRDAYAMLCRTGLCTRRLCR